MQPTVYCSRCKAENTAQAQFCQRCGQPLNMSQPAETERSTSSPLLNQRYRLVHMLGKGGMGAVYKAEDLKFHGRIVAVKEMIQHNLSPQEISQATNMFEQEARLLSGLKHPNLPSIYDYFGEGGRYYLVMDFIEGSTLHERLEQAPGHVLPVEETLDIGIQLAKVLGYLHNRPSPIIFRDLKPLNIMITPDDNVYLIDFGIARLFKPGKSQDTVAYVSAGYAAPEQYADSHAQTSPQSDIYSLGAVLHQLLSGHHPGKSPFTFKSLCEYNPQLPTILTKCIASMVQLDMTLRPATMVEVRQTLEQVKVQLRQSSSPSAIQSTYAASPQSTQSAFPPSQQSRRSLPLSPLASSPSPSLFMPASEPSLSPALLRDSAQVVAPFAPFASSAPYIAPIVSPSSEPSQSSRPSQRFSPATSGPAPSAPAPTPVPNRSNEPRRTRSFNTPDNPYAPVRQAESSAYNQAYPALGYPPYPAQRYPYSPYPSYGQAVPSSVYPPATGHAQNYRPEPVVRPTTPIPPIKQSVRSPYDLPTARTRKAVFMGILTAGVILGVAYFAPTLATGMNAAYFMLGTLLMNGIITGRLTIIRKKGFQSGAVAALVMSVGPMLYQYYTNRAYHAAHLNFYTTYPFYLDLILAMFIFGLIGLLGAWLSTLGHPYHSKKRW